MFNYVFVLDNDIVNGISVLFFFFVVINFILENFIDQYLVWLQYFELEFFVNVLDEFLKLDVVVFCEIEL